ncbi:MAG: sulfatase [Cyclobacteriaceae bacterium]|nr:sulfatase [Cyclobacteriaceae bacterium]
MARYISFLLFALLILPSCQSDNEKQNKRPNIVFLISEDNSMHYMDLFDPMGVSTPQIQTLAEEGVVFENAFSNAPVCSVARSTLITGTLAPRTAMHMHRKIQMAPMPEGLEMFPAYLRKAGYYTTNNQKKDYNAIEADDVWDESSGTATWRNRPESQLPFFHKETFMGSHESRLHFDPEIMKTYSPADDPADVSVYPYYPDTDMFRFTIAYHRDRIRDIDVWVGEVIQQLREDNLLDDTFIFYFGDHGGVLPGSKGYLYETGLHIPLVVYIPENYRHLVDHLPGTRSKGFVSFIDFPATVLNLAGLPIPEAMDGKAFLGKNLRESVEKRDETLGYADRFDEKYETVRSLRKGKWKYIRSYQPFYPDALHNNYRYKMAAFSEWRELYYQNKLDSMQAKFFQPKPAEMLFDVEDDPLELHNLAQKPEHQGTLSDMRKRLNGKLLEHRDLGLIPESILLKEGIDNPVSYGEKMAETLGKILQINDLVFHPFEEVNATLEENLRNGNTLEKFWTLNTMSVLGPKVTALLPLVEQMAENEESLIRWKAVECLAIAGNRSPFLALKQLIAESDDPVESLLMLNSLVYFKDHSGHHYPFTEDDINPGASITEVERRIQYLKGTW